MGGSSFTASSYTKGTQTLYGATYSYVQSAGNNGQIAGITDGVDAGRNATYTYDTLDRLSTAQTAGSTGYPQWGLKWTYDRYGNRTAQQATAGSGLPQPSFTVNPATNQITTPGYAYDLNGNMTNDGLNTITYDAENRIVSSSGAPGTGAYVYDGNGLRVEKCLPNCTSATTTTVYIYSGHQVIAAYDNGAAVGSPSREYILAGGTRARQDRQRRDGLLPPRPSLDARDHRLERQRRQSAGALPLWRKLVPKRRDAQLDAAKPAPHGPAVHHLSAGHRERQRLRPRARVRESPGALLSFLSTPTKSNYRPGARKSRKRSPESD